MNNNYQWNQGARSRAGLYKQQGGSGSKSFRQVVQQSRQDHLNLLRQDVNRFIDFAGSLRGPGFRGTPFNQQGVYDVQAVTAEDTPTTSAATSFQIDSNSLLTLQSGNLYTINGVVTGVAGSSVVISVWRGDPNTGLQDFDNNNPVLAFTSPVIALNNGSSTFSLVIDATKLPGNVPQPLSAANPWVLTASSAVVGTDLLPSDPVQVPLQSTALPTTPAFSIDAGSVRATMSGNILTITGTAREPNSIPAIVRIFKGQVDGSRYVSGSLAETQIGSNPVALAGGVGIFTVTIDLSTPPGSTNPPSATNPYVVTLTDTLGSNETTPMLVPAAGFVPEGAAAFSIDAGSVTATQAGNILTITGVAREPSNITAVARAFKGLATGGRYNDINTKAEMQVGTGTPTTIVNGTGVFTMSIDMTQGNASTNPPTSANPYVVTLCDIGGRNEMKVPVLVPFATTGTSSTVPAPTVTSPPSTGASTTSNFFDIQGTIPASAVPMLIQVWAAATKTPGAVVAPLAVFAVNVGVTAFTIHTSLLTTGVNLFVISAMPVGSTVESALVAVPAITTTSTTITPLPPAAPAPTTTPIPAPGPVAVSGTDSVATIQGIGPVTADNLRTKAKIHNLDQLMKASKTLAQRKKLSATLDGEYSTATILDWYNRAELASAVGIGPEYADLLEAAGVDSLKELAQRNPANLAAKLADVNAGHKPHPYVNRLPSKSELKKWIDAAGK